MQPIRVSLGIVTDKLPECREFYTRHFGFTVAADLGWYVHLRLASDAGNAGCDLGLVTPGQPILDPALQTPFSGAGVYLGVEVADAAAALAQLTANGIPILAPLRDEPWGERHFLVRDPAGCVVNVWQRIEVVRDE